MKPLIDRPYFGDAFRFGWRVLPELLKEHWWYYGLLLVIGALLSVWGSTPDKLQTVNIEGLVLFAAIPAATRFANPSFRMAIGQVLSLIGFYIVFVVAVGGPLAVLFLLGARAPIVFVLFAIAISLVVWIVGRFSLTAAMYALQDGTRSVFEAAADSWNVAFGETWWRIAGLGLCITIICGIGPGVAFGVLGALYGAHASFAVQVSIVAVYYLGSIPAQVWINASLVALASALLAERAPASEARLAPPGS